MALKDLILAINSKVWRKAIEWRTKEKILQILIDMKFSIQIINQ